MLRFLFPRLTDDQQRGAALFQALVAEARKPHWYVDGAVPDTLDGRFAMLATVVALATVRVERGPAGNIASASLTERFIEAMDAEHRQLGISDPSLGKTVRKLVAGLARRVDLWRGMIGGESDWSAATQASVFGDRAEAAEGLRHCRDALQSLWSRLDRAPDEALARGEIG